MKAQSGFTLIELLVSLTLLGLLLVLLSGGLRFGSRAWERSTMTADAGETVRSVQSLLRSEIERACPRRVPAAQPTQLPLVLFSGSSDGLRFLGPAPVALGGRSCAGLGLQTKPDGALRRLVLRVGDADTDVLRGVRGIEIAYLPLDGGWQSSWRGRTQMPALVRLRVNFPRGDGRVWPELFIAPRISAETDCTYDPATKSCRGS